MSIFSVDKDNADRGSPQPNGADGVMNRMAHQTNSTTYKPTSTPGNTARVQMVNGSLIGYDATNTPRWLLGQAPDDGREGFWISRPGQNVWTLLGGS